MEAACRAGGNYWMPRGHADDFVDTAEMEQASLEAAIPTSNRGYALLQRLGWKEGKGLGRNEDGVSRFASIRRGLPYIRCRTMSLRCRGSGDTNLVPPVLKSMLLSV